MEISKTERLILYNQYEILKIFGQREDWLIPVYETHQKILLHGYKQDYSLILDGYEDDLPEEITGFVWDVVQMYQILNDSYRKLTAEEKKEISPDDIKFYGFDNYHEYKYYCYCHYIVENFKRFTDICQKENPDRSVYCPTLRKYRQMVDAWKSARVDRQDLLTKEQILRIIHS